MSKCKSLLSNIMSFSNKMGERDLMVYAASGCYYLCVSLVPLLMLVCCLLPYTPLKQSVVMSYVYQYCEKSLADIIHDIVMAIYRSNNATMTISILLTVFSASASMKAIIRGLNAAYSCRPRQNFVIFTIRAIFYMILLLVTIAASLLIMVYGGKILALIQQYADQLGLGFVSTMHSILSKGRYFSVLIFLVPVFAAMYTLIPAKKLSFSGQLPGALFSAVTWVIFSSVFTLYINISDKYGAFGLIGTFMVAMMWIYYCLFFLLIGGCLNSYLQELREQKTTADA